jgi:iron complex transport system ATP-binding protein
MFAFKFHEVSAGYDNRVVLHSVTCGIAKNRTTVLLGPGGSGKSTLLAIMGGPYGARSPSLWSTGKLLRSDDPIRLLPQRKRRSEQRLAKLLSMRGGYALESRRQLTEFWCYVAEDVTGVLERNLDESMEALPLSLRRLAEFTLMVAGSESVLLLDEPDQEADERAREWILATLAKLRGKKTIVLISHNLKIAREASDNAILLVDGQVIEAGDTAQMFCAPRKQRTHDFVTFGS